MKYKKKPIVVEAFCWTGDENQLEDPAWIVEMINSGTCEILTEERGYLGMDLKPRTCLAIKTLEGIHYALPGDYIIRGIKSEVYPCKPDIFKQTYEPI